MLIAIIIFTATILAVSAGTAGSLIVGNASVVDGDTLRIGDIRVHLCGIDAPEQSQSGYHMSAAYLSFLVNGRQVRCIPVGEGTPCDGRSKPESRDGIVAQCFVDDVDIAAEMVRGRQARDFTGGYYSGP